MPAAAIDPPEARAASPVPGLRIIGREFTIDPQGPFSWSAARDVLSTWPPVRRFSATGGEPLRLAFPMDGSLEPAGVRLDWDRERLRGIVFGTTAVEGVAGQVARMFGLHVDGRGFDAVLARNPGIGRIAASFPGLRPVGFASPFEAAVWAILSQRISARQTVAIQDRLIASHGVRVEVDGVSIAGCPAPVTLLGMTALDRLPQVKIDRLRGVAAAALDGRLDPVRLCGLGDVEGPALLRSIGGIGPFWSALVYLRGCNVVDVFADEPIARAALLSVRGAGDDLTPAEFDQLTARFAPYRMWVAFLLRVAANRGVIPGILGREAAIRTEAGRRARPARTAS